MTLASLVSIRAKPCKPNSVHEHQGQEQSEQQEAGWRWGAGLNRSIWDEVKRILVREGDFSLVCRSPFWVLRWAGGLVGCREAATNACPACLLYPGGGCCALCVRHTCQRAYQEEGSSTSQSLSRFQLISLPQSLSLSLSFYQSQFIFHVPLSFSPSPSAQTQLLSHTLHYPGYLHS